MTDALPLVAVRHGFLAVRDAVLTVVRGLPADACFRGTDRMLMDIVWEPLQAPPRAWLLFHRLFRVPGAELGPAEDWAMRRDAMLSRYYHAVEAMIGLTYLASEVQADRPGTRNGRPDTYRAALQRSLEHDLRYLRRMQEEVVPRALALPALDPLPPAAPRDPRSAASQRRDRAAAALESVAATIGGWLAVVPVERAFVPECASPLADLMLHMSNKAALGEANRRMLAEDNPELGALASPAGFWAWLQETLQAHLEEVVTTWRSVPGERLAEHGFLAGQPYSVIMAIEDTLDAWLDVADAIQARLQKDGTLPALP